jgi:hypothetical protein
MGSVGRRWPPLQALVTLLAGACLLITPSAARAGGASAVYVSSGGIDTNGCTSDADACASLSHALSLVSADGTVYVNGTIPLSATEEASGITVGASVTIEQDPTAGAAPAAINGAGGSAGIFDVAGATLTLSSLTVENGNASAGGGAINSHVGGTIVVTHCTFTKNSSAFDGGAIDNGDPGGGTGTGSGTLTVTDSTFDSNSATFDGGAIDNADTGGGVSAVATGSLTVTGSTFRDNTAGFDGGAIDSGDEGGTGTAVVSDSTFAGNADLEGGGAIDAGDGGGHGTLSVTYSTFSGDRNGSGSEELANDEFTDGTSTLTVVGDLLGGPCGGSGYVDGGYNATTDASCVGGAAATTDVVSPDVASDLGTLGANGGATDTIEPMPGDQAIGLIPNGTLAGTLSCPTVDQRGMSSAPGQTCDAGAVQTAKIGLQAITFTSSPPAEVTVGGATYTPTATGGGSGNPVTFTIDPSTTYSTCAINGSGVVSFAAGGTCVIDANQAGNADYAPAPEKQQSFTVNGVDVSPPVLAPHNTAPPSIAGRPHAGGTLTCSAGSWSNDPTAYAYRWYLDGTPIIGAASASYTVQTIDEGNVLTCAVTAANSGGSGVKTSTGVSVSVPSVAKCPAATGTVSGDALGLVRLGMTRAQAKRAYARSSSRGDADQLFFCLTPIGVRVGFGSPTLRESVPRARRRELAIRVVWISTASAHYAIDGIRPGATVSAAAAKLRLGKVFAIGRNDWYLAPDGPVTAVFKARHGVIEELGIASRAVTDGREAQRFFLASFQ